MTLSKNWFPINEEQSDMQNVLNFIQQVPSNLRQVFVKKNSNFLKHYLLADKSAGISPLMFTLSFKEAEIVLRKGVISFKRDYYIDLLLKTNTQDTKGEPLLMNIGFAKKSLRLKAAVLNKLWAEIVKVSNRVGNRIIDFANNEIVTLVRRFLAYLNSILGSLAKLIPAIEPIKEIKEIIESYLVIADN